MSNVHAIFELYTQLNGFVSYIWTINVEQVFSEIQTALAMSSIAIYWHSGWILVNCLKLLQAKVLMKHYLKNKGAI